MDNNIVSPFDLINIINIFKHENACLGVEIGSVHIILKF